MFGKVFAAAALAAVCCAAAVAGDCVRIDLNYCTRGMLKLESELPEGISFVGPKAYSQPKFAKFCLYRIVVDLDKAQEFELKFKVVSGSGSIKPSAAPFRSPDDMKPVKVKCLEFEFCDEPSPVAPCVLTKWKNMSSSENIRFLTGDTVIVKAKFRKMTE